MTHEYRTQGVCATKIIFDIEDGTVSNIKFTGGCEGNLKALSRILDGMTVEQIEEKFKGLKCANKSTSCTDQLATAVRQAYKAQNS